MSHQSSNADKHDKSLRGRYYRWEQHQQGPCPVCMAVLQRHGSPARYHVIHDYNVHQRKGVNHVGKPYKPSDREMYREYGSWKERRKKEREKAARSKAANMQAQAHHEPTESEKRAKAAASRYVEEQTTSRESA